jgi:uncharacterized protein (DUF39 family)
VKNAVSVHVLNRFEELVDVELDPGFRQVGLAALDGLVQVHFHDLEDQSEAAGGFVVEDLDEGDDVVVGGESLERLDLSEVLDLQQLALN